MAALRDPDTTRSRILTVTANEMRRHGYKATNLAEIIKQAGVSKGALYHHFANKQDLGYATYTEVFVKESQEFWRSTVLDQPDPLEAFCQKLNGMPCAMSEEEMECGCPINSISQEMVADDEGFRALTQEFYQGMENTFAQILTKCADLGLLKSEVNINRSAKFIWAAMQGISSVAKVSRDRETLRDIVTELQSYLRSLKA